MVANGYNSTVGQRSQSVLIVLMILKKRAKKKTKKRPNPAIGHPKIVMLHIYRGPRMTKMRRKRNT